MSVVRFQRREGRAVQVLSDARNSDTAMTRDYVREFDKLNGLKHVPPVFTV